MRLKKASRFGRALLNKWLTRHFFYRPSKIQTKKCGPLLLEAPEARWGGGGGRLTFYLSEGSKVLTHEFGNHLANILEPFWAPLGSFEMHNTQQKRILL